MIVHILSIISLNNFTQNKHKKEMATIWKNGHKINVQNWYVQDSFVLLLFQNDKCDGNAVFLELFVK